MTHTQCRIWIAIALTASLFALSCSGQGMSAGSKKTCTRGGTTLEVGQSLPSTDGCNSCVCQADGGFACTTAACPSDAASGTRPDLSPGQICVDGGRVYGFGESFKRDCNTCTCTASGIACTLMGCPPPSGAGGAIAGTGGAVAGTGGAVAGTGGTGGAGAGTGGKMTTPDAALQGCTQGGHTYAVGENFNLDCNSCVCTSNGIACTAKACSHDASPDQALGVDVESVCTLSANLTFGRDGGNAPYWDVNRLTASGFILTRNYSLRAEHDGAATATCSPSLPPCGTVDAVTLASINADLALSDVQALWSLPQSPVPLFGTDSRPVDGTVYSIALDDGRKVLVGGQCASPTMSSCRYIPAGLVSLVQDLQKLATAMLADPVCKNL